MSKTIPTIKQVQARAVDAPLSRALRTASGTIPSAPLVLIDIETKEGPVGHAYIFAYTPLTLHPLIEIFANLNDLLAGKTVSPIERQHDLDRTFRLLGRQGLIGMAMSGIDMALWDVLGRANNMSVCEMLGASCKPIPSYDSYGAIDLQHDRANIEHSLKQGFQAIKIKLGLDDLELDRKTVAAVREMIGPKVKLMVDYNQALSVPEAIRRINQLAEFDLHWVEEPVTAENLAGHAHIRANCTVPIQTGENWWFPEDAARSVAAQASTHAMLDIMKIGGVSGWMRAAGIAEGASLPVSSHLFIEASAHTLVATRNAHLLEHLDVASTVLRTPGKIKNGTVLPHGPGLGIEWDEQAVSRYTI